MTIKKLLIFWDIDGTLITLPKKSSTRHIDAVTTYTKKKLIPVDSKLGNTDRGILREIFELNQIEYSDVSLNCCLEILNSISKKEITRCTHKLTPGIIRVLNLVNSQGSINSILTGNSMERATHKLKISSLTSKFNLDLGFFGDKYFDRESLVFAAKQEVIQRNDFTDFILIGDSPLDIIAGQKNNVKVVAVTTGKHKAEELNKYNPDLMIQNFKTDLRLFLDFLNN